MPIIKVYTDGSCLDNSKCKQGLSYGGYGCHILYPNEDVEEFSGGIAGSKITNNVGELMAFKKGLERCIQLKTQDIIHICSDSTYVLNTFSKWIENWKENGWVKSSNKPIENLELIQEIYTLIQDSKLVIIYVKVKAHQVEPHKESNKWYDWYGNDRADKLAKICAEDMKERSTIKTAIKVKEGIPPLPKSKFKK
jgi:ribonuclease HI